MNLSQIQKNIMWISQDLCCPILSFTKPFPFVISVTAGVRVCWFPVCVWYILITDPCCKLNNRDPNSASITLDSEFLIVVHSTCIGKLISGCISGNLMGYYVGALR